MGPFRLELRYDSAVEPIHLQVYLDTEKEAFTISDYAIAPAAFDRTYTATLQANEGTKDAPNWVNAVSYTHLMACACVRRAAAGILLHFRRHSL